ncbi:MAG: LysM peptidoglycan-binding domain-containing protein, partial [Acetivibrionales bacterium]
AVPNEMVFTTSVLKSWELEALEDADGLLTQVSVNLELQVDAHALIPEEQVIIEDAYSIDYKVELKKTTIDIVTDERELHEVLEINQRIRIEYPEDKLAEVLMVCANERNIASKLSESGVNVQGTLGVDVLYMTDSREIKNNLMELPFSQIFNLPDEGRWQVVQSCFNIDDVCFDISGQDTIELCIKLRIKVRMTRFEEITCTEALTAVKEENRKKAPIVLYFAHPGDTMWSIAKKYRIPLSRLALDNGIDASENLEAGRKLFIM